MAEAGKVVTSDMLALKMTRRAAKVLTTYSAVLAVVLIVVGGVLDIFALRFNIPNVQFYILAIIDLVLFSIGFFFGAGALGRLTKSPAMVKRSAKVLTTGSAVLAVVLLLVTGVLDIVALNSTLSVTLFVLATTDLAIFLIGFFFGVGTLGRLAAIYSGFEQRKKTETPATPA